MDGKEVRPKAKDLSEQVSKVEVAYAQTSHSMQGRTVHPPNKVFIDTDGAWMKGNIYTAISRAKSISQLYVVRPTGVGDGPHRTSAAKRSQLGLPEKTHVGKANKKQKTK